MLGYVSDWFDRVVLLRINVPTDKELGVLFIVPLSDDSVYDVLLIVRDSLVASSPASAWTSLAASGSFVVVLSGREWRSISSDGGTRETRSMKTEFR